MKKKHRQIMEASQAAGASASQSSQTVLLSDSSQTVAAERSSKRWPAAETSAFLMIYDQDKTISLAAFNQQWTAAGYESLERTRFDNKKMIVERGRRTKVAASNKKQRTEK
jgi:hypothetical protein